MRPSIGAPSTGLLLPLIVLFFSHVHILQSCSHWWWSSRYECFNNIQKGYQINQRPVLDGMIMLQKRNISSCSDVDLISFGGQQSRKGRKCVFLFVWFVFFTAKLLQNIYCNCAKLLKNIYCNSAEYLCIVCNWSILARSTEEVRSWFCFTI